MKLNNHLLFVGLTACAVYSSTFAQSIVPDSTFATNGKASTDINNGENRAFAIKVQSDNRIVVGGVTYNGHDYDFALVRYNQDGSLDASFGSNGRVVTDYQGREDRLRSIAIASDQKILAAGYAQDNSGIMHFCLNRYTTTGSLDQTFGNSGNVITNISNNNSQAHELAIQSDGKILVAGQSYFGTNGNFAIVRYNTNGTLDKSFNGTGVVIIDFGQWNDQAFSIQELPNGKIIVSGSVNGDLYLARLHSNGSLDASFGTNGELMVSGISVYKSAMAIQPDGKLLFAGNYGNDIEVMRLTKDGVPDSTFNSTGVAVVDFGNCLDIGSSLALQADGKIIVTGQTYFGGNYSDYAMLRFNADGSLDQTTSPTGRMTTDFYGYNDWGYASVIQKDGKILVAGESCCGTGGNTGYDFSVARYIAKQPVSTTNIGSISAQAVEVSVFPNPFTNQFALNVPDNEAVTLVLFNFSGQQILQQTFTNSTAINTAQFTDGLYFYELRSDKGVMKSGKLVKQ